MGLGAGGAIAIGGALGAAGSIAGASISASASESAAKTQASAANNATAATLAMYNQTQSNLAPYLALGNSAEGTYANALGLPGSSPSAAGSTGTTTGSLIAPFQPTMQQLSTTPGYQFTLGQGLEATQNGFAAQGLGTSGAAAKGAANYAEGLASTTYQNQFQNYLTQNAQIANILQNSVGSGQNAAAGLGALGLQTTAQANAQSLSGAAATAAGTVGSANALTSGISGVTGAGASTGLLLALNNQGLFGNNSVPSASQFSSAASSSPFQIYPGSAGTPNGLTDFPGYGS